MSNTKTLPAKAQHEPMNRISLMSLMNVTQCLTIIPQTP